MILGKRTSKLLDNQRKSSRVSNSGIELVVGMGKQSLVICRTQSVFREGVNYQ